MIFLMIVGGIITFSVSFALQMFFFVIMERWIMRLIPVWGMFVFTISGIISYNSGKAKIVEYYRSGSSVGEYSVLFADAGLSYFKMILILCGIAIIGDISAVIVIKLKRIA